MTDPTTDPVSSAPAPLPEPLPAEAAYGSHRLWALLLVLDSVFVIVFGGLVASKIYQHWNEPAPVALPAPARRRASRTAAPAKPAPLAAAVAVAPPEKPRAAATETPAAPPKPSLADESPASAIAADKKAKAKGVEFRLRAARAVSVQVLGAFIVHGGRAEMTRHSNGVWTVKLYLKPGRYRYFFLEDGRRVLDPANPRSDRGASLLTLP